MKMAWVGKGGYRNLDHLVGEEFSRTPLLKAKLEDVKVGRNCTISYWTVTPLLYLWTKYLSPLGQKDSTVPILNYWPDFESMERLLE